MNVSSNGSTVSLKGDVAITRGEVLMELISPGDEPVFTRTLGSPGSMYINESYQAAPGNWKLKFKSMEGTGSLKLHLSTGNQVGHPDSFSNIILEVPGDKLFSMTSLDEKIAGAEELFATVKSMVGMVVSLAFITGLIVIYFITGLPLTISVFGVLTQSYENSVDMMILILSINVIYILIGFIVVMFAFELSKPLFIKSLHPDIQS
jgi:hypothetical protein